jgi:acyl carrier protein
MMDPVSEKARLREFVTANFYVPAETRLDDTTSFLERGILDSTGVLELVAFVEDTYGITIDEDELIPSNFDSIGALAAFIARKRG